MHSLSAAFKFHVEMMNVGAWIHPGRVWNSHHSVLGSLVLIVSLISYILPKKGKQAEQAEVIAFPSEDKSGRFAIVFVVKTAEKRMDFKLNCFSALLRRCRKE